MRLLGLGLRLRLRLDVLHLDALLGVHLPPRGGPVNPPARSQALVALGVRLLELVVGRRAGAAQHDEPVLEPAGLGEGAVPVLLEELVRVEVLARRLAPGHEEHVVAHQRGRVEEGDEAVDDHGEGHAEVADGGAEGDFLALLVNEDLSEGCPSEVEPKECGAADEGEEIAVVATADAVVEPDAVVVLGLDAVVAQAAVVRPRGAPDVACFAVLGGHLHRGGCRVGGLDERPFRRRRAKPQGIFALVYGGETVHVSRQDLGSISVESL